MASRDLALREMRNDLVLIVDLARHNQVQLIDHTRSLLTSLAGERLTKLPSSAAFSEKLGWALAADPFLCNIGFIDPQGAVLSSAVPIHGKMYLGDRSYFKRALQNRAFSVGLFQIGRITGRPTINFGYPALDENKRLQGVLFAALDLSWIQKFAETTPIPRASSIFIIDSAGTVVARYPEAEKWVGKTFNDAPLVQEIMKTHSGVSEAMGLDGEMRTYAYLPIQSLEPNPLYIGVGFSNKERLAPYDRFLVVALVAFIVSVIISLFLARFLGRRWIIRPISETITKAARLAPPLLSPTVPADSTATAPEGLDELSSAVGALMTRVERSETALQETRVSLQQSEQRYQALVTRLPSVVWSANKDGKIVLISPAIRRMLGYEIEEVVDNTLLRFDLVHPDDVMTVKVAYNELFNGESFDLMYRMKHKSGKWIWMEDHAICLNPESDRPMATGVLSDLSERRRLEHEMFKA